MAWLFVPARGGLELAMHLLTDDYRTVGFVEREAYAAATLVARMEDPALGQAPVWDDVVTFDGRPWCGVVDLITAGYPCQPFSHAGKRSGEDDERHLWPHIKRIIGEVHPELVLLENVPGHLTLGFDAVRADLQGMGYRVEAGLFSASEVGAPHERLRLFVLAYRSSGRLTELRESSARRERFADGAGEGMVDASSCRRDVRHAAPGDTGVQEGTKPERRAQPDSRQQHLDDSEDRPQCGVVAGRENRTEASGAERSGLELPNAKSSALRLEPERDQPDATECRDTESRYDGLERVTLFPPRPNDREQWAQVLEQMPQVEPAICRVANELASRVDRLRLTGNGVHPICAAVAIVSLWLELMRERA